MLSEKVVYLPLETLDKCFSCGKSNTKLKYCTSCAEVLYCSEECQKADWKQHKMVCGVTDRLNLQSYYAFISFVMHECHLQPGLLHPAFRHQIINSPNPHAGDIVKFPNGASAKLVLLGPEISTMEAGTRKWWPTAGSDRIRRKMVRRILAEGLVLPIVLATSIALLSEIYTTTSSRHSNGRRVRLTYKSSPISDFGIVVGSVPVTAQDRLAYYNVENGTFLMGQDPDDHYWLYFKTLAGEEQFLECNAYTFNFCPMVIATPYTQGQDGIDETAGVAGLFFDRGYEKVMPGMYKDIWKIRKRFSVLREPRLHELVRKTGNAEYNASHMPMVYEIMEEISGRESSTYEKLMMLDIIMSRSRSIIGQNVTTRAYMRFPREPQTGIEADPEEKLLVDFGKEGGDEFDKYLKKWARRYRKGQISSDQWLRAFHAWREQPFAAHMKTMNGKPV